MLAKLSKTGRTVSMLEQNLSSFNGQVETSIRSMTEEGNKIKSMVDQFIAKQIATIQEKARNESKRLSAILDDHKMAFDKANALDIRNKCLSDQGRYDGSLIMMLKIFKKTLITSRSAPFQTFQQLLSSQGFDKDLERWLYVIIVSFLQINLQVI
ncbi:unnamed protein product [Mytilus edulis]|uniref:Uncharacterized protein n=1 Tax=Mytilus edulis TaxID=6550 RepID=A0A8S3TNJ2_MYTED|nr:unnamed protein product [Mytilus edulis]